MKQNKPRMRKAIKVTLDTKPVPEELAMVIGHAIKQTFQTSEQMQCLLDAHRQACMKAMLSQVGLPIEQRINDVYRSAFASGFSQAILMDVVGNFRIDEGEVPANEPEPG